MEVTKKNFDLLGDGYEISLTGFSSPNGPLSYTIWGLTNAAQPLRISLSPSPTLLGNGTETSSILVPPSIATIEAVLTGTLGERLVVPESIDASPVPKTNMTDAMVKIANLTNPIE
jgi:hypothetical protein